MNHESEQTFCRNFAALTHVMTHSQFHEHLAELARQRLFDMLGSLVAGRELAASIALTNLTQTLAADGAQTALDETRELCATIRASEVDDIHRSSCTTPGSVAVPVALALGDRWRVSGYTVLKSVVIGYEAMARFGEFVDGPRRIYGGVWPSYLAAPFAAAATTSCLLGLGPARTAHGLAIAVTRSVGTAGRIAAEPNSRWLTYGCAASDGVFAALAAGQGMQGDLSAIETALPGATDVVPDDERPPRYGHRWALERVDTKPFCGARQVQAAVEAARQANTRLRAPVEAIEVFVPEQTRAMIDQPCPRSRLASLSSVQFQLVAGLVNETLLFDVSRKDLSLTESHQELMRRTHVAPDPNFTAAYPETWGARVRLRASDGEEVTAVVRDPYGSFERPLGWQPLREKHRRIGIWTNGLDLALSFCRELGLRSSAISPRHLLQTVGGHRNGVFPKIGHAQDAKE